MDECDRAQVAAEQHLKAALAAQRSKLNRGGSLMFCDDCGAPIPDDRREAMPGCTRCVTCQTAEEKGNR